MRLAHKTKWGWDAVTRLTNGNSVTFYRLKHTSRMTLQPTTAAYNLSHDLQGNHLSIFYGFTCIYWP